MREWLFAVAFVFAWVALAGVTEFANSFGRREMRRKTPDMREAAKWYRLRSRASLPFVLMSVVTGWWLFRMAPELWFPLLVIFGAAVILGVYNMVTAKRRLHVSGQRLNRLDGHIFGQVAESPIGWSDKR